MRWIGKQELERKIGERLTDKEVCFSFMQFEVLLETTFLLTKGSNF